LIFIFLILYYIMSLITNNSSHSVLGPNQYFLGNTIKPEHKYITIQLTLEYTGSVSGLLEVFHSMDGIYYDTYGDSWVYNSLDGACHAFRETQIKGSYFYVKFTNTGTTTQTSFNLHTKITPYTSTVAVDGVINIPTVQVDIDGETVYSRIRDSNNNDLTSTDGYLNVFNNNNITGFSLEATQLDIKTKTDCLTFNNNDGVLELNVFDIQNYGKLDSIETYTSRLKADATYTDAIQVAVQNTTLDVSGYMTVNTISGFAVENGGNLESIKTNTDKLVFTGSNLNTIVSNFPSQQNVWVDNQITGYAYETGGNLETIKTNTSRLHNDTTYTNAIQVAVKNTVDVSGSVVVPHLNKSTDSVDISGQKVDISGQSVVVPHLSKSTDSVDISGQKVDISGQTVVVAHLSKATDSVDISGQSVVVPHLSKSTDSVDISGQKVDISGQSIVVPHLSKATDSVDISGQSVVVPHLSKSTDSVDISGQKVDISGQSIVVPYLNKSTDSVDISGQKVDISGQTVVVAHLSKSTDSIDISGQKVDISGQSIVIPHLNKSTDSVDISGQKVDISGQSIVIPHLSKSTDSVDISGQKVDISGQTVVVAHLSKNTDSVDISGQKVDISGQSIVIPHLNKSTDSVDISGQKVDISGQKVDISGQSIVVPHLSKATDSVDISGQKVDISGQTVVVAHLNKSTDSVDISGQKVDISGQSMSVSNASLDTHCYGSPNGTTWHHLATDANGQLNVHAKLQDDAGNALNSTSNALNVSIRDSSGNIIKTDASNNLIVNVATNVGIKDSSGNSIKTDTNNNLLVNVANSAIAIKDSSGNSIKTDASNNLLVNVASGSITVSSVNIKDSSGNNLTSTSNNLDVNMKAYNRSVGSTNNLTSVAPIGSSTTKALEVYGYNVCYNNSTGFNLPCTSTTTMSGGAMNDSQSQDVYVQNGQTTNDLTNVGLNTYQIYPKVKTYTLAGINSYSAANSLLSNYATNVSFSSVAWGKSALKTFYASMSAGSSSKYVYFEYVDSSGNLQTTAVKTVSTTSGSTAITPACIGINRFYFANTAQGGADNQSYGTSDGLYVSTTSGLTTPSYYGGFYYANWNSTYTCPNNKVAVLQTLAFYSNSGIDFFAFICDANGGRRIALQVMNGSNFIYQTVNLQINAGETLFFGTGSQTTPTTKQVVAQILQYDV
jgi:hypothetical protein